MSGAKSLGQWMVENDWSDETLAAKACTDRTTISRLRRGKQRPSWALIDALMKISDGEITADSFLEPAAEPKKAPTKRRRRRAA